MKLCEVIRIVLLIIIFYISLLLINNVKEDYIYDCSYMKCERLQTMTEPAKQTEIPNVIMQTYKSWDKIPEYHKKQIKDHTTGYDYDFFDDKKAKEFLKEHYGDIYVEAFDTMIGAHKADLFRYCYLYLKGGIYLDIKTVMKKHVKDIFTEKEKLYTSLSITGHFGTGVYQGILAAPPGHPMMKACVEHAISSYKKYGRNIAYTALCRFLYKQLQDKLQPKLKAKSYKNIVLFSEKVSTDCSVRDRYGNCTLHIVNEVGDVMFHTRDPQFGKTW